MKTKTEITYFINYGQTSRHLMEDKVCFTLKEANDFIDKLPSYRAFRLIRREEIFERISHGKYKLNPITSIDKILKEKII